MSDIGSSSSDPWLLSIDMDELRAECKARPENSRVLFRIPPYIRNNQPHYYDPMTIPMGMYNRDFRKKTPMDQLKLEILSVFLEHLQVDQNGWDGFCRQVAQTEGTFSGHWPGGPSLRHFYRDDLRPSFVTPELELSVLIIDAFFIVAMLIWMLKYVMCGAWMMDPPFIGHIMNIMSRGDVAWNLPTFMNDVFWLYECQVPLYLVENLWVTTVVGRTGNLVKDSRFGDVITSSVRWALLSSGFPYKADGNVEYNECDHLLACLHRGLCSGTSPLIENDPARRAFMDNINAVTGRFASYIRRVPLVMQLLNIAKQMVSTMSRVKVRQPTITESPAMTGACPSLPSATCLRKAGVRFKGVETDIGDIRFVKSPFHLTATLYLPKLTVSSNSTKRLMNLCAYELLNLEMAVPGPITSYVLFIDALIGSEEDVDLLMEGNDPVIVANNTKDDKEHGRMFANMLDNFWVELEKERFRQLKAEINIWYNTRWRRQLTGFLDRFVIAPWLLLSLVAAVILLVLTLLQTIYTMWDFYKQY